MSIKVHLSGHLKAFTGGEVEVRLDGDPDDVAETLALLWLVHPALRDRVLTEQGEIRQHVNILVGSDDVTRKKGLETKVDSSEIHIFNAVSGG